VSATTQDRPTKARRSPVHTIVGGGLAPGTTIGNGATVRQRVRLGGLLRGRVRATLSAGAGNLNAFWVKPTGSPVEFPDDGSSVHTTGNPAQVSLLNPATEYLMEIADFFGEQYLDIRITDTAGGSTIDQVTVSAI
jgi:hypothetical protein